MLTLFFPGLLLLTCACKVAGPVNQKSVQITGGVFFLQPPFGESSFNTLGNTYKCSLIWRIKEACADSVVSVYRVNCISL